MKYQINIEGMHCTGCVSLIKMTLEDDFTNVEVNLKEGKAEFESILEITDVESKLSKAFEEFNQYKYSSLQAI